MVHLKSITEDHREDPTTEKSKKDPITEKPKENTITEDPKEDPITEIFRHSITFAQNFCFGFLVTVYDRMCDGGKFSNKNYKILFSRHNYIKIKAK